MKTVRVNTAIPYDIIIGDGALSRLSEKLTLLFEGRCKPTLLIISDSNVSGIIANNVINDLEKDGFKCRLATFEAGEASKNCEVLFSLLESAAEFGIKRSDAVIAIGGGVTGDIASLTAALYMRGIPVIHIATSLLSMVDSSVGGKCAVNLSHGKNLAGVIRQPSLVICDTLHLKTLPEKEYRAGMAEVIKYSSVFPFSSPLGKGFEEKMIAECVSLKGRITEEDEFDFGKRRLLNFGHTVGHAVEKLSDYGFSHGEAVAIGMSVTTRATEKSGMTERGTYSVLEKKLSSFSLPAECPFGAEEIAKAICNDKKSYGNKISAVYLRKTGDAAVSEMSFNDFEALIAEGIYNR